MVLGKTNSGCAEEVYIFPASFAQQRLWLIDQLVPGVALYNVPLVFQLTGTLDSAALEQSFNNIIQRHEILRTTFEVMDGQLVQVIAPGLSVALQSIDLQKIPALERESRAIALIRQDIQRPFDLAEGPLLRLQLYQLNSQAALLLINLHHIIFDEWSSGILIRELGAFYTAHVHHQPVHLADLPIQYADFADWQREWLQGEVLNRQLGYWRQQLKDLPTLNLPGSTRAPVTQGYQGAMQMLELPQALLDALEKISQEAGVTLFMTLLAAFQTLLYRYTEQTDIAIGSPIANRPRSELEDLIGFFVNSLVLRTNLAGDPPFRELLQRVREVTLAAYAHQDLPFEKLVEELQPTRTLNQNPLFQVVFALQNTPMEHLELPGLTLSAVEFETQTTRFSLELYLWKNSGNFRSLWGKGWQQSDGLRGVLIYNTEQFEAAAIARLRQHLQTLLEGIVANPNAPLSTLPLLTIAEQQQLQAWQQTQTHCPLESCIHRLFEQQVRQHPEAIALQFEATQFTYQALNQGSNQLARYLQKLGVGKDTLVGICLERSPAAIAAMLAVLKVGGAYVPLDPSYPAERLRFMVKDAGISVVLTQQPWANFFPDAQTQVVCLEQAWQAIAQESDKNLAGQATGKQLAYVIYTSGSTGIPKGVAVPHQAVVRLVCRTHYIHLHHTDKIAQVANLAFDAATFEVWGALLNGAQLIGISREISLTPQEFTRQLQRQQISVLFLTTALFNQIVSQTPHAFQSLKYLLFGGEAVDPQRVIDVLRHGKPQHLLHVYGPTENTTFSSWYEIQHVSENASTIPIGHAIANTQIHLLDAHLNPVPIGISGEIYLGGAGLASGYLNRPELTAEKFIEHPFEPGQRLYRTGDRARYDLDGNLEFLGRIDNQLKIRGFRVELGEIEAVLKQHPAVREAVIKVQPLEHHQRLIAYVVPSVSFIPSSQILENFLKAKLPAYMVPSSFVVLRALPLTPNGKIDRRALPFPSPESPHKLSAFVPSTAIENQLMQIWSKLLGKEPSGRHDNFFDLGGHSLLATQLVSRVRDTFQVEIPLRQVFETPTLAELALQIEARHPLHSATELHREEVEL